MHTTRDSRSQEPAPPGGITRRDLLQTAAAAGAFAYLLPGCQVDPSSGRGTKGRGGDHTKPGDAKKSPPAVGVEPAHAHAKRATCIAPANGGRLVTSDDLGRLVRWSPDGTSQPFEKIHSENAHPIKAAYVSAAGSRVLTAGYDGVVNVHDLDKPALGNDTPAFAGHRADGRMREVWVAILTPDGKTALSATNDGQVLLWSADAPGKPASKEFNHPGGKSGAGPVGGLAFLPPGSNDPTHFLSTGATGDIYLWDLADKAKPAHTWSHGNSYAVNALAVHPGGNRFVSGGFDGTVRVFGIDLKNVKNLSKKEEKKVKGHKHWVWRVALSTDGNLVASAGQDGAVRVWDVTGKDIKKVGSDHDPGKGGSMGVVFGRNNTVIYTPDTLVKGALFKVDQI